MSAMASQITSLTIVYSSVYSGADQRKDQSSASLAFVRGIHRQPVNSLHKGPVTQKMFPFDDVIMEGCKPALLFEHLSQCQANHGIMSSIWKPTFSAQWTSTKSLVVCTSPSGWMMRSGKAALRIQGNVNHHFWVGTEMLQGLVTIEEAEKK